MMQKPGNGQYGMEYEAGCRDRAGSYTHRPAASIMRFLFSIKILFLFICFSAAALHTTAQEEEVLRSADSLKTVTVDIDSSAPEGKKVKKVNVYDPRKAAIRSAILPGWGQVYNRKYWKVPIVYGALGTSAYVFFFNLNTYKDTRFAYRVKYNMRVHGTDSTNYDRIPDYLKPISEGSLRSYRDSYRRDIDYSVIFFILLWGLNVVDAAVDSHLKSFDVSPDLSFRIKPGHSQMAGTTGLSFVVHIGKQKNTALLPSRF